MSHLAACSSLLAAIAAFAAERPSPVEPGTSRAWALATCAVLFELNGERHDLLAGEEITDTSKAETQELLEDGWDIDSPTGLIGTLEWLRLEGHRIALTKELKAISRLSEKEFQKQLAAEKDPESAREMGALRANAPRALEIKGGLLAWDYARFVALCRWGFRASYFSEAEAWKRIEPIAKELQKAYGSWEELGEAYCIGRECWNPGENADALAAFEKLKTDEKSPFKTTPWNLKLGKLDKPEKKAPAKK